MKKTFICKNCRKRKPLNPRLKGEQKYCGAPECQRARKAEWQRKNMAEKPKYYARQKKCVEKWRKTKPANKYQDEYRKNNSEYTDRNRKKQKIYNQKRKQKARPERIVKMDALENKLEKTETYVMKTYKMDASEKIVKMDTLFVELQVYHGDKDTFFASLS